MKLKQPQIQFLESKNGWDKFCVTQYTIANENKKRLLEMAKNGNTRPRKKTKLGSALSRYTKKTDTSYDPIFDKQIRKLRPDWFMSLSDIADQKKKKLLEMAKKGKPRPKYKNELGSALSCYTRKASKCYDPIFDKQIRKLRPDWFMSLSDIADQKKKKLLEMAMNGEPRPKQGTQLGRALCFYTNENNKSFCQKFNRKIRKLIPVWFVLQSHTANEKRKQLLEMARNGEPRPNNKKHKLGAALSNYTNPKSECYNKSFDQQIRKLRPDWFRKNKENEA